MVYQCISRTKKNNRCKNVTHNTTHVCHVHTETEHVTEEVGSIVSGSSQQGNSLTQSELSEMYPSSPDSQVSQDSQRSFGSQDSQDSFYSQPLGYTFSMMIDGRLYRFTDVFLYRPTRQPSASLESLIDTFTDTNCQSNCIVCLETGNAIIPCCLQAFCKECLLTWLTEHDTCPHCRHTVTA